MVKYGKLRGCIGCMMLTAALLCGCADHAGGGAETTKSTQGSTEESEGSTEAAQLSEKEVRSLLYDQAVIVTDGLKKISGNEAYVELYSGTDEITAQILEWNGALENDAGDIYIISADSEMMDMYMEVLGEDLSAFDEWTTNCLKKRIVSSFPNLLNGRFGGVIEVAAGGIASYSETFRMDGYAAENQIWLIRYTDEVSVCVSFAATGDDVLTVSASFVVLPELTDEEQKELLGNSSLEELGIECVQASDL